MEHFFFLEDCDLNGMVVALDVMGRLLVVAVAVVGTASCGALGGCSRA